MSVDRPSLPPKIPNAPPANCCYCEVFEAQQFGHAAQQCCQQRNVSPFQFGSPCFVEGVFRTNCGEFGFTFPRFGRSFLLQVLGGGCWFLCKTQRITEFGATMGSSFFEEKKIFENK